jgi:hypothetical protein
MPQQLDLHQLYRQLKLENIGCDVQKGREELKSGEESRTSSGVRSNILSAIVNDTFGIDESESQSTSDSPLGLGRRSHSCAPQIEQQTTKPSFQMTARPQCNLNTLV